MKKLLIIIFFFGALAWSITPPNYIKSGPAHKNHCVSNLKYLEGAKEQWAMQHKMDAGTEVTWDELVPAYIETVPVCLTGGTYTLGEVGTAPTCTVKGHVLP